MYDFVETRLSLTDEEKEGAAAVRSLKGRLQAMAAGIGRKPKPTHQAALQVFEQQLLRSIQKRLGDSADLQGGWVISQDGKEIIVCQVKKVEDKKLTGGGDGHN